MKAEQQIFLSLSEFEGLKLAISLSLDLLRNEFATDPHNTLRDGFRHDSPLTSGVPDYGNCELGLIAEINRALDRWLLACGIVPEQMNRNPFYE
jgi:hypothetical protein